MFLTDRLAHWARTTPDACAIHFDGQPISFAQLEDQSKNAAANLQQVYDVRYGDRVAYLGLNHPNLIAIFFACIRLGAIFTPLNTRLALAEYEQLIADAEPIICVADTHFEKLTQQFDTENCKFVLAKQVMVNSPDLSKAEENISPNAAALLVYTSGTTGKPKGVVLSQQALEYNIDNNHTVYNFVPGQKILITLPLFHVGGLCILLLPALIHGAGIYLHSRFDPVAALSAIATHKITSTIFVPAQMSAFMALPQWAEADLSSLTHVAVGSSLIPLEQIRSFHQRGIPVSQVYGATETGPTTIALNLQDALSHEGSAGTIAKNCDVQIRTSDGEPSTANERGEIWVRGKNILTCYWRNKEETDAVLVEGWYNTGDVGYQDKDGFFWIVDRVKDVIISGGENIYPAEVEAVSLQHPSIAAIAIVGRPHEKWGETPVAAIELHPDAQLDDAGYMDFLQDRLARYKQPRAIVFMDELPRNVMGKIEKPVLRKLFRET